MLRRVTPSANPPYGSIEKGGSAATSSALFVRRMHQRIARGGKREERAGVAAGVWMHSLGGAAERLMDFGCGEPSAERQAQHLAIALIRGERLRLGAAPAEFRR